MYILGINGTSVAPGMSPVDRGRRSDETIGIIIGVLVTLIVLLLVIMIAFCIKQRRNRAGKLYGGRHISAAKLGVLGNSCGTETPLGTTNTNLTLMNDLSSVTYDSGYGGGTATLGTSGIKMSNGVGKMSNGKVYSGLSLVDPVLSKMKENEVSESMVCPGMMGTWGHSYNRDALDLMQRRRLPELPRTPESTGQYCIAVTKEMMTTKSSYLLYYDVWTVYAFVRKTFANKFACLFDVAMHVGEPFYISFIKPTNSSFWNQ